MPPRPAGPRHTKLPHPQVCLSAILPPARALRPPLRLSREVRRLTATTPPTATSLEQRARCTGVPHGTSHSRRLPPLCGTSFFRGVPRRLRADGSSGAPPHTPPRFYMSILDPVSSRKVPCCTITIRPTIAPQRRSRHMQSFRDDFGLNEWTNRPESSQELSCQDSNMRK